MPEKLVEDLFHPMNFSLAHRALTESPPMLHRLAARAPGHPHAMMSRRCRVDVSKFAPQIAMNVIDKH